MTITTRSPTPRRVRSPVSGACRARATGPGASQRAARTRNANGRPAVPTRDRSQQLLPRAQATVCMTMFLRTYTPSPPLDAYIDRFWLCSDTPQHPKERILPSGTVQLLINLRGRLNNGFLASSAWAAAAEPVARVAGRQEGAGHAVRHREVDPRLAAGRVALVVLAQPAVPPEPPERPLDDPPLRQVDVPLGPDRAEDGRERPPEGGGHPIDDGRIRPVGPDHRQPRERGQAGEDGPGPVPVLHAGRQDRQPPDQAERVNDDVPLAAGDLFSPRRSPWGRRPRWS